MKQRTASRYIGRCLFHDQVAQLCLLQKEASLWGHRLALVPSKPRRGQDPELGAFNLASEAPVAPRRPCSRLASVQRCGREGAPRLLLGFDYISLGLGRGKPSFKLCNPFPGSSGVSALRPSDLFPGFFSSGVPLPFFAPTAHAS